MNVYISEAEVALAIVESDLCFGEVVLSAIAQCGGVPEFSELLQAQCEMAASSASSRVTDSALNFLKSLEELAIDNMKENCDEH